MERPLLGVWMLGIGFVAIALVMVKLFSAAEQQQGAGIPGTVGTAGTEYGVSGSATGGAASEDVGGRNAEVLESIVRSGDDPRLIGRHVELQVDSERMEENLAAFWMGDGNRRVLVVLHRDTRTPSQRQDGEVASHGIAPAAPGQPVTISGTVQRLPRAEEMASWRLTRADRAALQGQRVYIRAHTVRTAG